MLYVQTNFNQSNLIIHVCMYVYMGADMVDISRSNLLDGKILPRNIQVVKIRQRVHTNDRKKKKPRYHHPTLSVRNFLAVFSQIHEIERDKYNFYYIYICSF